MRNRAAAIAGSALFLVVAPGTIAGLIPWLLSRWRFEHDFGSSPALAATGAALILLGLAGLIDSFIRFAWKGLGTPAPVAPANRLIVSGLYRHVRNPMYVAVLGIITGQALVFGQAELLVYAALILLAVHLFVVFYEEPTLQRQFPDDYRSYRAGVPRWFPRLRGWTG